MSKKTGTALGFLILVFVIAVFAGVVILRLAAMSRRRANDASAYSESYNRRIAEELFFERSSAAGAGSYATSLSQLTDWDQGLTKDAGVTFLIKTTGGKSGYTFTTHHDNGRATGYFVVSNEKTGPK